MYKVHKENWLRYYTFTFSDFVCLNLAFLLPLLGGIITNNNAHAYFGLLLVVNICFCVYVMTNNTYDNVYGRNWFSELKSIVYQVSLIYAWTIVITFVLKNSMIYSRLYIVLMYCLTLLLMFGSRHLFKFYDKKYRRFSRKVKKVVVFTYLDNLDRLDSITDSFQNNGCDVYDFIKIVILDDPESVGCGIQKLITKEDAYAYIKTNVVDGILICVDHYDDLVSEVEETCLTMGVVVHYVLNERNPQYPIKEIVENVGEYRVVTSGLCLISARQLFFKRLVDIVGSLIGLVITGICFLFVAPMIYSKSPGPIFYSQVRVGTNGRHFKIYKFRSMYVGAEKRKAELLAQNKMDGLMFKMDNDPRIIPGIGKFIRRTSIDELPQMLNVLLGDMSLVGTRPPTLEEFNAYGYHHKSRLAMKPGITGLWQISGRSQVTNFEDIVAMDTQYIREWNIFSDIKIILTTVKVVFARYGAV